MGKLSKDENLRLFPCFLSHHNQRRSANRRFSSAAEFTAKVISTRASSHEQNRQSQLQRPIADDAPPTIQYELADKIQAIGAGGLGVIQQIVKQLGLAEDINRICPIFKLHLLYSEADHVLNMAFNLLAGGTCLEHLELRRQDEACLNALGAERIPAPTTAGDFCRRFSNWDVFALMESFHEARLNVGKQQPDSLFDQAIIEGDGTQVETSGEHKEGMSMNDKGEWGDHPLIITLANTREVLYPFNRPGNRPSHERASAYFDRSSDLCRRAGFRSILLCGDTDFSQSRHLDRWHGDGDGIDWFFGHVFEDSIRKKKSGDLFINTAGC